MFSVATKRTTTCTPRSSAALIRRGGVQQTRFFTPIAIYSRFPFNFFYYRNKPKSSIFDRLEIAQHPSYMVSEAVDVAPNRLVYPKAIRASCNGVTLLPDTVRTEELVRNYYENFLEYHKASGQQENVADMPVIYTISQTTEIPPDLILIFKNPRWYTLQPSHGMQIRDLNNYMDEFFEEYATKETVKSWLSTKTIGSLEFDSGSKWAQPLIDYKQKPFPNGYSRGINSAVSRKVSDAVPRETNDAVLSENDKYFQKEVKKRFPILLGNAAPNGYDEAVSGDSDDASLCEMDDVAIRKVKDELQRESDDAVVFESDEDDIRKLLEDEIPRGTSNAVFKESDDAVSK